MFSMDEMADLITPESPTRLVVDEPDASLRLSPDPILSKALALSRALTRTLEQVGPPTPQTTICQRILSALADGEERQITQLPGLINARMASTRLKVYDLVQDGTLVSPRRGWVRLAGGGE